MSKYTGKKSPTHKTAILQKALHTNPAIFVGDGNNDVQAIKGLNEDQRQNLVVFATSSTCELAPYADFILNPSANQSTLQTLNWLLRANQIAQQAYFNNLSFVLIYMLMALALVNGALVPWLGLSFGPGPASAMMLISTLCLLINSMRSHRRMKTLDRKTPVPKRWSGATIGYQATRLVAVIGLILTTISLTIAVDTGQNLAQTIAVFEHLQHFKLCHISSQLMVIGLIAISLAIISGMGFAGHHFYQAWHRTQHKMTLAHLKHQAREGLRDGLIYLLNPLTLTTIAATILASGLVCAFACGHSISQVFDFLLYPSQFWNCPMCGRLLIIGTLGLLSIGFGLILQKKKKKRFGIHPQSPAEYPQYCH